jgi:hypothetical protein
MLQPGDILRIAQLKRAISEFFDHGPKTTQIFEKKPYCMCESFGTIAYNHADTCRCDRGHSKS